MQGNEIAERGGALRATVLAAVVCSLVFFFAPLAMAAPGFSLDIPIDTVVDGDDDDPLGVIHHLATRNVPAEFHGQECTVRSVGLNQESEHPDNDLLVQSGGTQVVVPDVESDSGATIDGQGTLILGPEIVVNLRMGPDYEFSAGLIVEIRCTGTPDTGRIIVVKEVTDGSSTSQVFDFVSDYDTDGFSLSGGQQNDSGDLAPGTYSVVESLPAGWNLVSATCDDQSPADAIDLSEGETVTCTFLNEQVQDVVGASIVVTVSASCQVDGGEGVGTISVGVSVDDGATVVIRDSAGEVMETLNSDGSVTVAPGATYTWEATPNTGFEFPPGFVASGSIDIEDCTPSDEVGASILVTVDSFCDDGDGFVDIDLSVAGGATVVVSDSDGDVMGTLTADGTITVPEGATYTWVATPSEGFEFPSGFASSGTITIESCSDLETLPFTGIDLDVAAAFAAAFLGAGITVLASQWRREEQ